jgi:hypothetical protein
VKNDDRARGAAFVEGYGRAWEDWDVEDFVGLFSDDIVYVVHPTDKTVLGRDALAGYLHAEQAEQGSVSVRMGTPLVDGHTVVGEFWVTGGDRAREETSRGASSRGSTRRTADAPTSASTGSTSRVTPAPMPAGGNNRERPVGMSSRPAAVAGMFGSPSRLQRPFNYPKKCHRYCCRMQRIATAGTCATLALLSLGVSARAATLTVDSATDSGAGSLRAAITKANASPRADRIAFSPGIGDTIALKRSLPVISAPLRVEGPGATDLSLTGSGTSHLLAIDLPRAGEVEITGLTLRGGVAAAGGAIASNSANLVLDHVVLTGNRARGSGGALAISGGTLTLLSSRLAGNRARLGGGAIRMRGAGLNVASSRIVSNAAGGDGGGIAIAESGGGLLIEGSTIAGNHSGRNGGAISLGNAPKKALALSGSRLLDNRAAGRGGAIFSTAGAPAALEGAIVHGNASGAGGPAVVSPRPAPGPRPQPHPVRLPATAGTNGGWSPTALDRRMDSVLAESLTVPDSTPAGPSATLLGGVALAPPEAPAAIQAVIGAANEISHTPYIWGGGHGSWFSPGYDCSGAVSFALHGGGFLSSPLASGQLESWGAPGPGRWLTVYANASHAYAVIAGLRWDTVGDASGSGPRWHLGGAYPEGFVVRHPPGY